jgi:hypothetical protein
MNEAQSSGPSTKKIVLLVLLCAGLPLVALFFCCGGLALYWMAAFRDVPVVQATAIEFVQGLSPRDIDATYQNTSASFQTATTLDQFKAYVARFPALGHNAATRLGNTNVTTSAVGPVARVSAVVATADQSSTISCTVTLIKENGVWKVSGLTVP